MARRKVPLITDSIYHVFNHANGDTILFPDEIFLKHFILTCKYYRLTNPSVRFSYYQRWFKQKGEKIKQDHHAKLDVNILAYAMMPNHFHLLLEQKSDGGVSHFMSNIQNSFTRFHNTVHETRGHLFEGQFKAVLIETEEQLLHVSRYIHLNPVSAGLTDFKNLETFEGTSFPIYSGTRRDPDISIERIIHEHRSMQMYKQFTSDNGDYQRQLAVIKKHALD